MTESDPAGPPAEHTAGDVGARRHSVGESVRVDESGSLNVPPTQVDENEDRDENRFEDRDEEREEQPMERKGGPMDLGRAESGAGPSVTPPETREAGETREGPVATSRRVRERIPEEQTAGSKHGPRLAKVAVGAVALMVVRRLLRRRRK
ncbi:hypothetical protein [Streptosporangium sp. KLBMP 9127]|nr:hypothetical protein [Streptosporangium sp. KLBMP 9127]